MPLQFSHTSIYAIFSNTKSYTTHNTPVCSMYPSCTIILLPYGSCKQKIQSYRSYPESQTLARTTPKIPNEFARSQEPYHGGGADRDLVLPIAMLMDADEREDAPAAGGLVRHSLWRRPPLEALLAGCSCWRLAYAMRQPEQDGDRCGCRRAVLAGAGGGRGVYW
jgi:hypothetical protein